MGSGILSIFTRRETKKEKEVREKALAEASRRTVLEVTFPTGEVRRYADVETACRILHLNPVSVKNCLKGAQKKHMGYEFKEVKI